MVGSSNRAAGGMRSLSFRKLLAGIGFIRIFGSLRAGAGAGARCPSAVDHYHCALDRDACRAYVHEVPANFQTELYPASITHVVPALR